MSTVQHVDAPSRIRYRGDIDGLRGVAIILVVAFHVGVERFFGRFGFDVPLMGGGFIGVDVFYVISGFLITSLLLKESWTNGRIDLRAFYGRRVRRLLPSSALVLIATLVASWVILPPVDLGVVGRDAIAAGLYVSNIWFAVQATDYMAGDVVESPVLQYWSLSLEEQFYLIWPWVIALIMTRVPQLRRQRVLIRLTILVIVTSFLASVVLTQVSAPWAHFGLPTRAWELGVGAGVALAASRLRRLPRPAAQLATAFGLMAILASAAWLNRSSAFPGWVAAIPVFGTAAVIGGGLSAQATMAGRLLSTRHLVYVGRISYVWYLWHWPFIVLAGPATGALNRPSAQVVLLAALLSFGAAALTHAFFEDPIRHSRLATTGLRPFGLAVASAGVVAALAFPLIAVSSEGDADAHTPAGARADRVRIADGCGEDFLESKATACEFGDPGGSRSVALVGDSHAMHLVPMLEPIARERGWHMLLYTKGSCPPIDTRRWLPAYTREYVECDRWRDDVMAQIEGLGVDLVVLSRFGGYSDSLIDESGARVDAVDAPAVWEAGARRTFSELQRLGAEVVILRDVPNPGFDVPSCLSSGGSEGADCSFPAEGHVRWDEALHGAEARAASGFPNVSFVDLSDQICETDPCSTRAGDGVIKYRDGNHLTATFSASLAPVLAAQMGR